MRKLVSLALCTAILGTVLSATQISGNEPKVTLSSVSPIKVSDGYIKGIEPDTTVNDILCHFENKKSLTVTSADGRVLEGGDRVASEAVISSGNDGIKLAVGGDVSCDGKVNTSDVVTLLRTLAGWDVNYSEISADITRDSKTNTADAVTLLRYLAGWDVELCEKETAPIAENEDSTLEMYFDSVMNRTPEEDTESTGNYSYTIQMAKNEIEDFQIFISSEKDRSGMSLEVGTFTDASGNTLDHEVLYQYYYRLNVFNKLTGFDLNDFTGGNFSDPLPKIENPFELRGDRAKGFVVKVKSTPDTVPGLYKADINLMDGEGKTVKTAKVYTYVWDFALNEETACDTAFHTGYHFPTGTDYSKITNEDLTNLYKPYYDYLLENRVSSYRVPYDLLDSRADEYLNNPRVTSAIVSGGTGYGSVNNRSDAEIVEVYKKLRTNPEWLDKGYIYTVDEPYSKDGVRKVREQYEWMEKLVPEKDFQIVVPLAHNEYFPEIDEFKNLDSVEYMAPYLNIWCPQSYAFGKYYTKEERDNDPTAIMPGAYGQTGRGPTWTNGRIFDKFGQFEDRYNKFREQGNKMWWYICCSPEIPYLNFFQLYQGVNIRGVLWQQYMYDIDGLLYWATTNWEGVSRTKTNGGDGLLLYYGELFGQEDGPVTSIRFESVRDGIEDFQYLTQLEEALGRAESMKYVNQFTTDILKYNEDYKHLEGLRRQIGFKLEALEK